MSVFVEVDPSADWQGAFRQAVAISNRYEGSDSLTLTLAGEKFTMEFPQGFTQFGPELEVALHELAGVLHVSCR